jgi:hypothetical protein
MARSLRYFDLSKQAFDRKTKLTMTALTRSDIAANRFTDTKTMLQLPTDV